MHFLLPRPASCVPCRPRRPRAGRARPGSPVTAGSSQGGPGRPGPAVAALRGASQARGYRYLFRVSSCLRCSPHGLHAGSGIERGGGHARGQAASTRRRPAVSGAGPALGGRRTRSPVRGLTQRQRVGPRTPSDTRREVIAHSPGMYGLRRDWCGFAPIRSAYRRPRRWPDDRHRLGSFGTPYCPRPAQGLHRR